MNLRLSVESLRLRLSPQDVELCEKSKTVQASVQILDRSLQFSLDLKQAVLVPFAQFADDKIKFEVPDQAFMTWLMSSEIEYSFLQKDLNVLIEKDLKPKRSL
jgi:hypothetical protein